jgi:hypothetical protein
MANYIIMVDFPITFTGGKFNNSFRAFVEEKIHLRMQNNVTSCNIVNNGGFVQITNATDALPTGLANGKAITVIGGDYQPENGTVTSFVNLAPGYTILTSITFVAVASGVRFFFWEDNLRMKYRFTTYTGVLDVQTQTNLFGDSEFIFYPNEFGELYIDISIIKHLHKPSFTAGNDYNSDMAKQFEVQYQTLFDGNSDTWHSAHDTGLASFEAFLSVHATGRTALIDLWNNSWEAGLDTDLDGRLWRGYDKIFSILTPEVETPNNIQVQVLEYSVVKALITNQVLVASRTVADGLLVAILTSLNASTRYLILRFSDTVGGAANNYDYNLTVYDTNEDENEFYITWVSDNGTIRQWLFTNKILFDNDVSFDALTETNFRPIPNEFEEIITVEAKGISAIEREYISSLFVSNKIQVENNGETIECVIDDPSWTYENRSNSYIVTIQLRLKPIAVMNV